MCGASHVEHDSRRSEVELSVIHRWRRRAYLRETRRPCARPWWIAWMVDPLAPPPALAHATPRLLPTQAVRRAKARPAAHLVAEPYILGFTPDVSA